jgi:prolyl-tRNA editing enzyme YbaK/EbsC (Cys-tRNA(Pro) deacylase)
MSHHSTVTTIIDLLKKHNVWFETFEHEPVRTSEEAAKLRHGYTLQQGAKALIVRIKIPNQGKKFLMVVLAGDARFDEEKVKVIYAAKDIRFATEAEVSEITAGVQPGGVPPFGPLFGLEVLADPKLLENEKIIFNAGDKSFSIAMRSADYLDIVQPRVADIT